MSRDRALRNVVVIGLFFMFSNFYPLDSRNETCDVALAVVRWRIDKNQTENRTSLSEVHVC